MTSLDSVAALGRAFDSGATTALCVISPSIVVLLAQRYSDS